MFTQYPFVHVKPSIHTGSHSQSIIALSFKKALQDETVAPFFFCHKTPKNDLQKESHRFILKERR